MKIFKLIIVSLLFLLELNAVFAQQDFPTDSLRLNWLSEEIVRNNEALSAMELRLNAKRALIESADALDDPRISYSIAPSSIGDDIPSDFGNALGVRSVIQVSQAFPWPGKLDLRSELSETDAAIAEYSYEELLLSLVNRGRSLWAELWYVEKALATNENHKALLSDLEAVVATQYASGIGLQQDLLQIQSDLVDRELQETMLVQERRRIKAAINLLLNNNADTALASPASEISEPDLPEQNQLQTWISDSNPMLLRMQSQSHQALTEQRLIEKEDFPDWQLMLGYNEIMNDSSLRFQVGVSVNIPLDFGNRSARKSAASFEYNSSLYDLAYLENELEAELEQQLAHHEELARSIELSESDFLPIAEQTFAAARANYEGGGGNFALLVEAQRRLLNIRLQLDRMRAEKLKVLSEIDGLSGGMLWPVEER
ncbi:MAG: hypothetical protein CMQ38_07830 [Gammaproteobacteria bacterium]|nr:hypothetical protein [Gammaproteobacteria bacterium]